MTRRDDVTMGLPGVAARPGRPPTGKAKTGADRQAAYRKRKAQEGKESLTVYLDAEVMGALRGYVDRQNANTAKEPIDLAQAVDRVLRDRLLRPR